MNVGVPDRPALALMTTLPPHPSRLVRDERFAFAPLTPRFKQDTANAHFPEAAKTIPAILKASYAAEGLQLLVYASCVAAENEHSSTGQLNANP